MKNYNIYGILKVRMNINFFPKFLETGKISSPDLEVIGGDFNFNKNGLRPYCRFPIKSYIGNKKVFVEYSPKKQLFKLLLEDLEGHTKFHFREAALFKPFHNVIFPAWPSLRNLIRFLLQIKFLQKGVATIHAATLSKNGTGILLPAWPSTGKSTACHNLINNGFEILGDEISFFSNSGKAYKIFESGVFSSRSIRPPFSRKKPFHFDSQKIFEKLNKVILLKKGSPKIQKKKPRDIINMVMASTNFEFQNFFTRYVFLSYCFSSNFEPDFVDRNTRNILKKALKKTKCYVVYGDRTNFHKTIRRLI